MSNMSKFATTVVLVAVAAVTTAVPADAAVHTVAPSSSESSCC